MSDEFPTFKVIYLKTLKYPGKLADEKENTLITPKRADSINRPSKNVKKDAGTGKVKEFVQIFSQEADLKPKPADIQTKRSQSFRWREVTPGQKESEKLDNVETEKEAEDVSHKVLASVH